MTADVQPDLLKRFNLADRQDMSETDVEMQTEFFFGNDNERDLPRQIKRTLLLSQKQWQKRACKMSPTTKGKGDKE